MLTAMNHGFDQIKTLTILTWKISSDYSADFLNRRDIKHSGKMLFWAFSREAQRASTTEGVADFRSCDPEAD
jgi:hypothetical protein